MVSLNWVKLTTGGWCGFYNVKLDDVRTEGVYIIWHAGNPGRVVYVGQGDVRVRLLSHRQRADINGFAQLGALHVTWASVPAAQRDGVERFLADKWNPLIGDAHPQATHIAVNSPW